MIISNNIVIISAVFLLDISLELYCYISAVFLLDICLEKYCYYFSCVPTGYKSGIVEFVEHANTLREIQVSRQSKLNYSLYFRLRSFSKITYWRLRAIEKKVLNL